MQRYHNYQPRQKKKARKKPEKPKLYSWVKEHLRLMPCTSFEDYMKWCQKHKFRCSLDKSHIECWEERSYYRSLQANLALKKNRKLKNLPLQILRISKEELIPEERDSIILNKLSKQLKKGKGAMACIQNRFLYHLAKESNLLEELEFVDALSRVIKLKRYWFRDFSDWKTKSHNREKQFYSLIHHLFAQYEVPEFITRAFFSGDKMGQELFIHIGQGKSVRKFKGFKLHLTKREAHHFMQAPGDCTIMEAMLWAQTVTLGGSPALAQAARASLSEMSSEQQGFWQSVIRFFIDHPSLKPGQLGPVVDYIRAHKYQTERIIRAGGRVEFKPPEKPHFSMKGRNPKTLLQLVEKWHQKLARKSSISQLSWLPMGPKSAQYTEGQAQSRNLRDWKIIELLNGKELAAEGRALSHCVATYAHQCMRGKCSIWSVYCNEERVLTLELRSANNTIIQIRGKRNRLATPRERRIVRRWAAENKLNIAKYA